MSKPPNNKRLPRPSSLTQRALGLGCAFLCSGFAVCAQEAVENAPVDAATANDDSAVSADVLTGEVPGAPDTAPEKAFRRDPFWPVGYTPPAQGRVATQGSEQKPPEKDASEKEWDDAAKSLVYQGSLISSSGAYAIINNQMCQTNDVLTVRRGGKIFRFRVKNLAPGKVQLERLREARAGAGN